jgi:hypothetical protein
VIGSLNIPYWSNWEQRPWFPASRPCGIAGRRKALGLPGSTSGRGQLAAGAVSVAPDVLEAIRGQGRVSCRVRDAGVPHPGFGLPRYRPLVGERAPEGLKAPVTIDENLEACANSMAALATRPVASQPSLFDVKGSGRLVGRAPWTRSN